MPTPDRASTLTQTSDRPTRAAVVLTLAMMVVPLLTLAGAASGCSRSARSGAVELRGGESGDVRSGMSAGRATVERSPE
jgi:hypothetical protein